MNGGEADVGTAEQHEKGGGVDLCDAEVGAKAVSLEELRKRMADFARERDWEQFHFPRNLLLALVRPIHSFTTISWLISFLVPVIGDSILVDWKTSVFVSDLRYVSL